MGLNPGTNLWTFP